LRLRILFFGLVSFSSLVVAQQDPVAFVSAGRGFTILHPQDWEPEPNTSISVGYRLSRGLMLAGYIDFNSFSFQGDEGPSSTGSSSLTSFLVGVKASAIIPASILSPYFFGAVGPSKVTSDQDTVFTHHHGFLQVFGVSRGTTVTFLGAVGSDIRIYKGFFCFGEVRASAGLNSHVYDFLIAWRAGIGYNLF
jgi:hypothetical protein